MRIVDGAMLTMPDTQENQAAYPQPSSQKRGLGFPMVRIVVVFSLAVLNLRSLKSVMQMDHLRCLTPEMVRKEIAMHRVDGRPNRNEPRANKRRPKYKFLTKPRQSFPNRVPLKA